MHDAVPDVAPTDPAGTSNFRVCRAMLPSALSPMLNSMAVLERHTVDGLEQGPAASGFHTLLADLRFASPALESDFQKAASDRSRRLGRTFHFNRAGVWGVVLLRALASQELAPAALVLAVLLLPAVTACLPPGTYRRWRVPLKVSDNLLQILVGCRTHRLIYPNPASGAPSSFQVAAVLLTGNGVPWQLFNSLWGSIPFRYALPQQAALTIVLLLFNRTLCSSNLALQHAYQALRRSFSRASCKLAAPLAVLLPGNAVLIASQAVHSCIPAILAGSAVANGAARAASLDAAAAATAAGRPSALAVRADDSIQVCLAYQPISQLMLGFVLPTYLIWSAELRSRRAFLATHRSSSAARAAGGSAALGAPAGHPAAGQGGAFPGLVEYLMFVVPSVLCMWSLVAVHA